jgi:uncharacterized membrane protein YhaH (DUF805 family)
MALLMKILHGIVVLFMLLLALLQINDPDPVIWTAFYILCALPAGLALTGRRSYLLNMALLALSALVAAIYLPGLMEYFVHAAEEPLMQGMNEQKPYIEEAREFIGALIVFLILAPYAAASRPRKPKA